MKIKVLKSCSIAGLVPALVFMCCLQAWSAPQEPNERGFRKSESVQSDNQPRKSAANMTQKEAYQNLPLQFEENQGQADPSVRFISHNGTSTIFLTATEAVIVLNRQTPSGLGHPDRSPRQRMNRSINAQTSVVKMKILGINSNLEPKGTQQFEGTMNYFIGRDRTKWHTNIPTYSVVQYNGVYPGIDLVYHGNGRQLEYDFVLHPGADSQKIALRFEGTTSQTTDGAGNLSMETEAGRLILGRPSIYQMVGGGKKSVRGSYVVRRDHSIGLALGRYDASKILVVDPVLLYSSYLGGSAGDWATSLTLDSAGNTYIGGSTISQDFPSAGDALPPSGVCVGFVTKLNASLSAVTYSSFLGGTDGGNDCSFGDGINDVAVDSVGQVYATGVASSTNFPTTVSAFQPSKGNAASMNAFISKLSPDGSSLIYSSYLGGSGGYDYGLALVVDGSQNVYVVGQTASGDFPLTTSTALQTILSGPYPFGNGFLTRIDTTKSGINSLVYSTVLGGTTGDDAISGIALDSNQNAYLIGWTSSSDFPITQSSAFQSSFSPSQQNYCAFVTWLDMSQTGANMLKYSTYLCGTNSDWAAGIAIDATSNVYVSGEAFSADFPSTFGQSNSTNGKGFAAKLNLNLTGTPSLVYSRLLGGETSSFGDWPGSIAVDPNGNAYIVGHTSSVDFPVTTDALQSTLNSSSTGDGFLTVLSPDGFATLYSTYLGGSGTGPVGTILGDQVYGLKLDNAFNIYMVGMTFSGDFPTTASGLQKTFGGGSGDGFLTVLSAVSVPRIMSVSPSSGIAGSTVLIDGSGFDSTTGTVTFGGVPASIQSWSPATISAQVPNTLSAGTADVVVTTTVEASNAVAFTVENLTIGNLSPTNGPSGTPITIHGTGFGLTQVSSVVSFNGVNASVNSWSDNTIVVVLPAGVTTGNVVVSVGAVESNPANFTVVANPSIIASLTPRANLQGWNNSAVTVTFQCTSGGLPVVSCPSSQTISTEGAGQVIGGVTVDAGGYTSSAKIVVNIDLSAPTLRLISPDEDVDSESRLDISGSVSDAFSGVASVSCDGIPVTIRGSIFTCPLHGRAKLITIRAFDWAGNGSVMIVPRFSRSNPGRDRFQHRWAWPTP